MKKVLIADDEQITLRILSEEFSAAGYDVTTVEDGQSASLAFRKEIYQLVLLDMQLAGKTGLELLREIRACSQDVIVIITTSCANVEDAVEVMKMGANDYITKPYSIDDVLRNVSHIFTAVEKTVRNENTADTEDVGLFGNNLHIMQIKETIRKIKDISTTILITGESGTGKGVIAKEIHKTSKRAALPFVHVNCAAIPPNLIESELFGHERGAFTGAVSAHPGRFERAGKGTVFLDEIGLMPLSLQSKLLNVLQERVFERVGGVKPFPLESRIIAATNVNLEQCVEDGLFRSDLYYRLNVVRIEVLPLRYRMDDILPLTKLFIRRFENKMNKKIVHISNDFYEALLKYHWPGNIRELENALESAVALCDDERLTINALPLRITQDTLDQMPAQMPLSFKLYLKQQEGAAILSALEKFNGHREKTAQYLGISKRTLQYKLKNLNLLGHNEE